MALASAEQEAPFIALKRPKDHRKCVGVMLLNARNEVFVACRADGALLDKGDDGLAGKSLWQCPQGGIDKGEDFLVAAKRELYEETGITSVEVIGEVPEWLCYQFPKPLLDSWLANGKGWGGKYVGQAQRWFFFRFTGEDSEVDLNAHGDPEFCEWKWIPFDERVADQVVAFKRKVYDRVIAYGRDVFQLRPVSRNN